jgi:chromosome transmission fidelity protein 4
LSRCVVPCLVYMRLLLVLWNDFLPISLSPYLLSSVLSYPQLSTHLVVNGNTWQLVKDVSNAQDLATAATTLTRFSLPARAVSFSPSGSLLAAAGDDGDIKFVSLNSETKKVIRTIPSASCGHSPYVRSIVYDPEGDYVAVTCADGTLTIYDAGEGTLPKFNKKKCVSRVDPTEPYRTTPAWHPDGSLIAVPKQDGSVQVIERMSWEVQAELGAGDGSGEKGAKAYGVAFSPNGLYLAAVSEDKRVRVWYMSEPDEELCAFTLPDVSCSLVWHPTGNAIMCMTEAGEVAVFDDVIPTNTHLGPCENVEPTAMNANGMVDDVAGEKQADAGADDDDGDSFIEDDIQEDGGARPGKLLKRKKVGFAGSDFFGTGASAPSHYPIQEAFQPGSTKTASGRRYLAYNSLGSIILRTESDHNIAEVNFHDTSLHRKRIPLLNDFYGFHVGSLSPSGALYASMSTIETPSTVHFTPFNAWTTNAEWTLPLPLGEDAIGVAAGATYCVVANNRRMIRLFSLSGLQANVMSMPGDIVSVFADGPVFGVVYHAGYGAANQVLEVRTFDFVSGKMLMESRICLSNEASLAWIGFTDEHAVATYDSEGIMRVFSPDFGGSWIPIFDASLERKGGENFWVFSVSMVSNELQCIVCADTKEPVVPSGSARPVVTAPPLHVPVVQTEEKLSNGERDMVRIRTVISQLDADVDKDLICDCELAHDKAALGVVKGLLEQNNPARAYEVVERIMTAKALEGALRIAHHFGISAVVERVEDLIAERQAIDSADDMDAVNGDAGLTLENGEPNAGNPFVRGKAAPNPFLSR